MMQPLKDLINTPAKLEHILRGSCVKGATFQDWYDHRFPLVNAINRSGTILDIGCANGFLLRCLVEWSEHTLEPYGIEPDEALSERCKDLFLDQKDHFATLPLQRLSQAERVGLPRQYDFVYWCVWDNLFFDNVQFEECLEQAYSAVKESGRLILGFYDGDIGVIDKKIGWLEINFQRSEGRLDSKTGGEVFVWYDKPAHV